MKNKISLPVLINVILSLILIVAAVFAWFYLKKVNPVSEITARLPLDNEIKAPKYLFTIYGIGNDSLKTPNQVLVYKDQIFVSDSGNRRVVVYDYTGAKIKEIKKIGNKTLQYPYGMAILNGNLLVADLGINKIVIFDPNGQFKGYFAEKTSMRPANIEVDGNSVYVSDIGAHRVLKFDPIGKLVAAVGKKGEGRDDLYYPHGLKIIDDKLYVADADNYRIKVYDKNSLKLLDVWDKNKHGEKSAFAVPRGLAIDNKKQLWVSNMLAGNVLSVSNDGKKQIVVDYVATKDDNLTVVNGIFIDDKNRLYVCDRSRNIVVVYQIP
ncbi:hypothetical protein [Carboxydocella sp. ULO1]|uniref:hypothetical protein n=1 Tax=Carboxydocella sp. ULO1 TaxID=1926599 RepID=UPI0009AE0E2D|nr:hypothetical protein [Carboxydocella sp. ULO1]GAW29954.1 NHL repeat containing protein [Carboxydocella sp. ULO1]